jgi:hypothetical protein
MRGASEMTSHVPVPKPLPWGAVISPFVPGLGSLAAAANGVAENALGGRCMAQIIASDVAWGPGNLTP